jgi:hypothetical protein
MDRRGFALPAPGRAIQLPDAPALKKPTDASRAARTAESGANPDAPEFSAGDSRPFVHAEPD